MKKRKILVLGAFSNYVDWILNSEAINYLKYKSFKPDLVVFTGGADVDPIFYGEPFGWATSSDINRDVREIEFFRKYENVPKLGICRGAQLLTVLSGGSLIQDVSNHAIGGTHKLHFLDESDLVLDITSTHHQMMYPFNLPEDDYKIIATPLDLKSNYYLDGNDKYKDLPDNFIEPEIVFYPKTKSLCIQGHPEKMNWSQLHVKLNDLINKLLF